MSSSAGDGPPSSTNLPAGYPIATSLGGGAVVPMSLNQPLSCMYDGRAATLGRPKHHGDGVGPGEIGTYQRKKKHRYGAPTFKESFLVVIYNGTSPQGTQEGNWLHRKMSTDSNCYFLSMYIQWNPALRHPAIMHCLPIRHLLNIWSEVLLYNEREE